ncbi:unnamed protein product [Cuscuta europaea]|uniref:Uncharacterized protein n=1 Tax=Cuscuta europaea TaxID=41803 RepID=A0A9P1EES8_CUSEU|nr:unnamed protein product [Cuscuta europaea]
MSTAVRCLPYTRLYGGRTHLLDAKEAPQPSKQSKTTTLSRSHEPETNLGTKPGKEKQKRNQLMDTRGEDLPTRFTMPADPKPTLAAAQDCHRCLVFANKFNSN